MPTLPRAPDDDPAAAAGGSSSRLVAILANPYLTLVSRLVLGGIFLLAGLTKLGVPDVFTASINSYEVPLPDFVVQAMAVALPPIEIGLGIWLLAGLFTRATAAVTSGLMVIFLVALIQAWVRGLSPDCGCVAAGPSANPIGAALVTALGPVGDFLTSGKVGPVTVLRDLVFLLMGIHLVLVPTVFSVDSWRRKRLEAAEAEFRAEEDLLEEDEQPAQEEQQPQAERELEEVTRRRS